MLTVPASIKNLYKADGIRKNFRVHFPFGDRADITNENIVAESLSFTESIMSENNFRFGCAERSVIEFETVGIENIYGRWIECGIEIDTTSLSSADLTAIQSDPGDGTLVLAANSDIGYGYYRIPFGVFKVTRCPRNHENMTHRQVQAMSPKLDSPMLEGVMGAVIPIKTFTTDFRRTAVNIVGYWDSSTIENIYGYTKSVYKSWSTIQSGATTSTVTIGSCYIGGRVGTIRVTETYYTIQPLTNSNFYLVERTGTWADRKLFDKLCSDLVSLGATFSTTLTQEQVLSSLFPSLCTNVYFGGYINYTLNPNDCYGIPADGSFTFDPKISSSWSSGDQDAAITLRWHVSYEIVVAGDVVASGSDLSDGTETATIYTLSYSGSDPTSTIQYTESYKTTAPGETCYQHQDSFDPVALGAAFTEISGFFIRPTRFGKLKAVFLDNSSPVSISPGDIESLWWDEYDVLPVSVVVFIAGNRNALKEYRLLDGYQDTMGGSVYDLTQNMIPQIITSPARTTMQSYIKNYTLPQTAKLGFTPFEMTIKAFPWIEAGDSVQITTGGGETVNSYVLRHSIHGIQNLMDIIETESGRVEDD